MCGRQGGLLAGLCTEQMDAVMLGKTAIVTAKHSASAVLCHRIRQSSSLTGATLQTPTHSKKTSGLPTIKILCKECKDQWQCNVRTRKSVGRKLTFVASEDRQQPASRCWWSSDQQLLPALHRLGAKADHPQHLPAHDAHQTILQTLFRVPIACDHDAQCEA